jgi:hypothetical protein
MYIENLDLHKAAVYISTSKPASLHERLRTKTPSLISLVIAVGTNSPADEIFKQVTCQTGSVWGRLDDYDNPLLSMYPYFNLLAQRSFYNPSVSNSTYFTKRYRSASRNVDVISPARPGKYPLNGGCFASASKLQRCAVRTGIVGKADGLSAQASSSRTNNWQTEALSGCAVLVLPRPR